jgi:hypothetical protein
MNTGMILWRNLVLGFVRSLQQIDIDAVYRAGRQAKFAAGTFIRNDGVHHLGSTNNGIDWTGGNTECAADTFQFAYFRDDWRRTGTTGFIKVSHFPS